MQTQRVVSEQEEADRREHQKKCVAFAHEYSEEHYARPKPFRILKEFRDATIPLEAECVEIDNADCNKCVEENEGGVYEPERKKNAHQGRSRLANRENGPECLEAVPKHESIRRLY